MAVTLNRRVAALAAAGALLTAALAACDSSGGGSSSSSGGSSASGPIKLMVEGLISGPTYAFPQMVSGAQAAAARINAAGGVGGRKIEIVPCDDKGSPNNDAECGRKAVSSGITAAVGGISLADNEFVGQLDKADIPYIAPGDTSEYDHTKKVAFPLNSTATDYTGAGAFLAKSGCKTASTIAANQAATTSELHFMDNAFKAFGGTSIKDVLFDPKTTDFSATVATATASTNCVVMVTSGTQTPQLLTALGKTGKKITASINLAGVSPDLIKDVDFGNVTLLSNGVYYLPGVGKAPVEQFVADLKKQDPKAEADTLAENAYNSVLIFQAAAKDLKSITPKALLDSLDKQTNINTGFTAPIDFTRTGPIAGYPQVKLTSEIPYKWNGSKLVLNGDPTDVAAKS